MRTGFIRTGVLPALLLVMASGCSSPRRAPAALAPESADLLRGIARDFVTLELDRRQRLRRLQELLGGYLYSAAEAREAFRRRRREAVGQAWAAEHDARLELDELEQLERRSAELRVDILARFRGRPGLLRELALDSQLRIDVTDQRFEEASRFPIEVRRRREIETWDDLDGEVLVDNGAVDYRLELGNRIPPAGGASPPVLRVRLECDRPVSVKLAMERDRNRVTRTEFTLHNLRENSASVGLELPREPVNCALRTRDPDGRERTLRVATDTAFDPDALMGRVREVCAYQPSPGPGAGSALTFLMASYQNITCAHRAEQVELLSEARDAFNRKLIALTGSELSDEALARRDPDFDPDFSRAPRLDFVVVSALEFKADFSGHILARALHKQAARGAKVRIIVPGIGALLKERDRRLLRWLERSSPNVQVLRFRYDRLSVHRFHRNIHAKILVTLSREQPEHNLVITGGRNIKDTFLLKEAPDYSKVPHFTQYRREEPFIHFQDLDVLVRGTVVAQQVAAQVLSLWNHDRRSMLYRPTTLHVEAEGMDDSALALARERLEREPHVRHLTSLPYADDRQMEKLFVDLIDGATRSVRIVSPYFNPRRGIAEAVDRATARGVSVQLITRLDLRGDNTPRIAEDSNKVAVNRHLRRMAIRTWTDPSSILHVKALQVDEGLLYIGGTNLNERSFTHDVESGFVITGAETGAAFRKLFEEVYVRHSEAITEPQRVRLLNRWLLKVGGSFF